MDKHQVDPRNIGIELTESIFTSDYAAVNRTIEKLKAHGVKEYLNKPFTPEAIRDILATCLKERDSDPSPPG